MVMVVVVVAVVVIVMVAVIVAVAQRGLAARWRGRVARKGGRRC